MVFLFSRIENLKVFVKAIENNFIFLKPSITILKKVLALGIIAMHQNLASFVIKWFGLF